MVGWASTELLDPREVLVRCMRKCCGECADKMCEVFPAKVALDSEHNENSHFSSLNYFSDI